MSTSVERSFHVVSIGHRHGGRHLALAPGPAPAPTLAASAEPRTPRISRLMALAIHFQDLLDRGAVADASALARLCRVSQPRMTQILNLTLLAPDLQERLLFLAPIASGRPIITEKQLRPLALLTSWDDQRRRVAALLPG